MENILAPSILSANFADMASDFRILEKGGVKWLHVDVMDGLFVPNISLGLTVISSIRKATDMFFDVHLMIVDPIRYIDEFAKAGADLISFHLEATEDADAVIDKIRAAGKKVGIVIKPKTPTEALLPYVEKVDDIMIMSVEPGFGGQSYIPGSTERIAEVKAMAMEKNPECLIEVDGGVTFANIPEITDAGANVLVAGSAVYKGDIAANLLKFKEVFPGCLAE
jgi:ribulose-phosphate 3-epimerase